MLRGNLAADLPDLIWKALWQDTHAALKTIPGADKGQGRLFWGAQQRFFKQVRNSPVAVADRDNDDSDPGRD
jgi:hypothetical protein